MVLAADGGLLVVVLQVEGGWKLSASFPVDSVGEYTLRLTRQVDVSKLKHISTRRSSEYDVVIPQMEVRINLRQSVFPSFLVSPFPPPAESSPFFETNIVITC